MSPPPHSLNYIWQVLAEYFTDKPVRQAQVFGSYARGEATAKSDLDVLLSREPGSCTTLFDPIDFQNKLERRLGVRAAPSSFTSPHIKPNLVIVHEQAA